MTLPPICPPWCITDHSATQFADDLVHVSEVEIVGGGVIVELRQDFGQDAPLVHIEQGWGEPWIELSVSDADALAAVLSKRS